MNTGIGIGLAFVAMLSWGFGDFLIQKATRKIGDFETLFVITLFGSLVLLPFVYKDLSSFFVNEKSFFIPLFASAVLFFAALFDFEALKKGKLSVIEPIWSFEVLVSAALAFFVLGETISQTQSVLIVTLIVGLALVAIKNRHFLRHIFWEKGVFIALLAAVFMGGANFFVGWGSRLTNPLLMNFFLNVFITGLSFAYLLFKGRIYRTVRDSFQNVGLLLPMSISDNIAWVAFAFAMSLAPIAIATALSESYIIVAVLLGLWFNKEHLHAHQKMGLLVALSSAIALAATSV